MKSNHSQTDQHYQAHLKHLKLQGLSDKTIEAYARGVRRANEYFDRQIDKLTEAQLTEYFSDLKQTHSWTTIKHALYGLKFYYAHVLKKAWPAPQLIRPPTAQRLPDIVTVEEALQIFAATRILSYRVFFFTLYSLGLRLGEGLRLTVADIDAVRHRVHIRDSKGNRDRLVPLPDTTLNILRGFWHRHRHPQLLFPNRQGGLAAACRAKSPLDRGGVQASLRQAAKECGLKKRSRHTPCVTAMPRT